MRDTTDTGYEIAKWLGGAAAGALLMYMLDPDRGGVESLEEGGGVGVFAVITLASRHLRYLRSGPLSRPNKVSLRHAFGERLPCRQRSFQFREVGS